MLSETFLLEKMAEITVSESDFKERGIAETDDSFKYAEEEVTATVQAILFKGGFCDSTTGENSFVCLVLDRTPFYCERGGQKSDQGEIRARDGAVLSVLDVQSVGGYVLHYGTVDGCFVCGGEAACAVEKERRAALRRGHTAAHVFDEFLFQEKVPRSDFSVVVFPDQIRIEVVKRAWTRDEIESAEKHMEEHIKRNLRLETEIVPLEEVLQRKDILSVFEEKYPKSVRVVTILGVSSQACGGTHTETTGELVDAVICGEKSLSGGKRKVTVAVGKKAVSARRKEREIEKYLQEEQNEDVLSKLEKYLKDEGGIPVGSRRAVEECLAGAKKRRAREEKERERAGIKDLEQKCLEIISSDEAVFVFSPPLSRKETAICLSRCNEKNKKVFLIQKSEAGAEYSISLGESSQGVGEKIKEKYGGRYWGKGCVSGMLSGECRPEEVARFVKDVLKQAGSL
ncbi:MAG: alanyl-tRNA synthetase [Amphiamblys sp. WSBS2006]|nr:MAG: alanyl-tRNA synthetase [Amphiamblys sp. WSBS2006]